MKTLEFYRSPETEEGITFLGWRWRMVASNGQIVADGAEGYRRLAGVQKGARAATWYHLRPDVKTKTTRKWGGKRFE